MTFMAQLRHIKMRVRRRRSRCGAIIPKQIHLALKTPLTGRQTIKCPDNGYFIFFTRQGTSPPGKVPKIPFNSI
jgi:hypothetical protein